MNDVPAVGTARMVFVVLIVAILGAGAAALVLRAAARRPHSTRLTDVHRQHVRLFQGGQVSEAELASAVAWFQNLFARSRPHDIEASLQPGTMFAVRVRALIEIGTTEAAVILERTLARRLAQDPLERAWYVLDLVHALRRLQRAESLPTILLAFPAGDSPLRHFLAAETLCFNAFPEYLERPETAIGAAAHRVLHAALSGLRHGVQPHVVAAGRIADSVERVWARRHDDVIPMRLRILVEATRLVQRAEVARQGFGTDQDQLERFNREIERLEMLVEPITDFLTDAGPVLLNELKAASGSDQPALLAALTDLEIDTGEVVKSLLISGRCSAVSEAIESLRACTDPSIGAWLCTWAKPGDRAVLRVLRHFPGQEAEQFLLEAAQSHDSETVVAALGSLGWWEPLRRTEVLAALQSARHERRSAVRRAAEAALARLGERRALQWFRQQFTGEQPEPVHHAIQWAADEGLTLLWPDLDRLIDAEDGDVAFHACEALQQLRERFLSSASIR